MLGVFRRKHKHYRCGLSVPKNPQRSATLVVKRSEIVGFKYSFIGQKESSVVTTLIFAITFVGLLVLRLSLWALFLRMGLRWAKAVDANRWRIAIATVTVPVVQFAMNVLFNCVSPSSDVQFIALVIAEIAAAVIVPCAIICALFELRFLRAVQACSPTLLATLTMLALMYFIVRPLVYEAFTMPTNAMAPTLIGTYWKGTCPECGAPNYCTPRDEAYVEMESPLMICDNFHVSTAHEIDRKVHSGDRFMSAKFLAARRWDLVVFQYPAEPKTMYSKRLVGLPGEKIHIKDGSLWVNGERQTPPETLQGLAYVSELPGGFGGKLWGSEDRVAELGDDEYFMLGDFSAQSMDSRLWTKGAPGYHPYAVPKSYLRGVVTHTVWPPSRWRVHR